MKVTKAHKETLRSQLREDLFAWLAFAVLLAWIFGLYWSNVFALQIAPTLDAVQMRSLWLAAEAVTLIIFFVTLSAGMRRSLPLIILAGSTAFAGTAFFLLIQDSTPGVGHLVAVGCTGVGGALMMAYSGIHFSYGGPQRLLANVALALLVASCIDTILLLLPSMTRQMLVALLPVVYVCFALALQRKRTVFQDMQKEDSALRGVSREFLIRVVVLPLFVGLAYGIMQRFTAGASTTSVETASATGDMITILTFVLSAGILALASVFFKTAGAIKLICFVAIPLVGVAFVLLPLFSTMQEAAQAVCIVGFNSFYFMVWALWAGKREGLFLAKRFVLGLFMLIISESFGSAVGTLLLQFAQESGQAIAVISLVVVYLLLMAGLFSLGRSGQDEAEARSHAPLQELRGDIAPPLDKVNACVERYHLSDRERDVFSLLIKGRNRTYISQTLFISDNTTRTHMRNIYRKLNVHSHQELIDVLEEESF